MTMMPPTRGSRPKEVEISFWLWITYLALTAIGVAVMLTQLDRFRAEVINNALAQDSTVDRSVIESVASAAMVVVAVVAVLFVVFGVILAFLLRRGRNWARIVLAVIGGLFVLLGLIGLAIAADASSVTGLLQLLLLIGAIVTMFLPAANPWFRPRPEWGP